MTSITPCLWFDGDGLDAAEHYVAAIPDSRITHVSYYDTERPGERGPVLTVEFELAGRPMQALNGGPQYTFTEAVSLSVDAADQAEVDRLTDVLTADGGEIGPCGWIKDRWGLSWQIVPTDLPRLLADPDPARAHAALQAMMGMTKIDVAALHAAADAAGAPGGASPTGG
jgi:predicted 3-demethylubiquinone-9 3-methyltransferase (glyoxalase superfamily)